MKKAKRFIVKGRVQGVGFRYFTNHVANALGIYGYVKNLYDGSVEVYAIGSEDQLEQLKAQITKGPSYSSVTHVIEEDCDFMDYFSFTVKY